MNNEDSKKIMAKNIKRYMEMKGVTNQQLCDALNFKYTTFMDWIKGVTYPRIGKIEAMADYFGILKSDLIEEKPQEYNEMKKNNDAMSNIIVRMRTDEDFFEAINIMYMLDSEKFSSIKQMLTLLK